MPIPTDRWLRSDSLRSLASDGDQTRIRRLRVSSRLAIPALLAVAALNACSEEPIHSDDGFDRQSAVMTEELRIDGNEHTLTSIPTVAIRKDGTIAMPQPQEKRIRLFSEAGAPLGSFGRSGSGPGEFSYPVQVGWLGDTLWVHDAGRLTFVSNMSLVRTAAMQSASPPKQIVNRLIRHPELTDQTILSVHADGSVNVLIAHGDGAAIGRVEPDGAVRQTLLALPPEEDVMVSIRGGAAALPFGNLPRHGSAHDGSLSAVAMASIRGEEAGTFRLWAVDEVGDTLFARSYQYEPELVTKAGADSAIDVTIELLQGHPGAAGAATAIRQAVNVPEMHAPLERMFIGNDRTVWIEQRLKDGHRPYYVVGPDGSPVGMLTVPENHRLVAAETDRVWSVETDELGVQSLVRYGVAWQEEPEPGDR